MSVTQVTSRGPVKSERPTGAAKKKSGKVKREGESKSKSQKVKSEKVKVKEVKLSQM